MIISLQKSRLYQLSVCNGLYLQPCEIMGKTIGRERYIRLIEEFGNMMIRLKNI